MTGVASIKGVVVVIGVLATRVVGTRLAVVLLVPVIVLVPVPSVEIGITDIDSFTDPNNASLISPATTATNDDDDDDDNNDNNDDDDENDDDYQQDAYVYHYINHIFYYQ